jgi:hypothetical protein
VRFIRFSGFDGVAGAAALRGESLRMSCSEAKPVLSPKLRAQPRCGSGALYEAHLRRVSSSTVACRRVPSRAVAQ